MLLRLSSEVAPECANITEMVIAWNVVEREELEEESRWKVNKLVLCLAI